MNSPRELRRRIRSISSTAQITKAMQMVAASRMRKAQLTAVAGRPFVQMVYRIQREASTHVHDFVHPLLEKRDVKKRAVILIGADKGLCGPLNSNLFRMAVGFDAENTLFVTAGRKAAQFILRIQRKLAAEFSYGESPRFAEARAISAFARDLFLHRGVDQVQVLATRFVNTLTQQPLCLEFLPIGEIKGLQVPGMRVEEPLSGDINEALFEPDATFVLDYLLPRYLDIYIYQALLNAKASELSARMVSMKNATENAEHLMNDLTLEYNKLRQSNITKELLEIAGGQAE